MSEIEPEAPAEATIAWNKVASYASYEEAQAAVDRLSDERLPVEKGTSSARTCDWSSM
ncbi:hypothetical protein [Streptomyces sp. NPDC006274]|uniref:hypothetical protein n=1 Tax=unclassified Streptomyces TaxID=2593676 RepID=UPI0033BDF5EC